MKASSVQFVLRNFAKETSQSEKLSWLPQAWRKIALDFNANPAPDEVTSAPLCSRDEIIQVLNRRQNSKLILCPFY